MLQPPKDLADKLLMDLRHHCAEDPVTGAYLIRSEGRRKAGRPRKYFCKRPGIEKLLVLYGYSDRDVLSTANLWLETDNISPQSFTEEKGKKS